MYEVVELYFSRWVVVDRWWVEEMWYSHTSKQLLYRASVCTHIILSRMWVDGMSIEVVTLTHYKTSASLHI